MHTETHANPAKAPQRPLPVKTEARTSTRSGRPQPSGLTREELRKIIIDLIG